MKNLKHTPTPWILCNDSTIRDKKNKAAIIVAMGSADNNHPETVANAKLIASAPELLEALTECRQFIIDNIDILPNSQQIRFKALAAIIKATE